MGIHHGPPGSNSAGAVELTTSLPTNGPACTGVALEDGRPRTGIPRKKCGHYPTRGESIQ